MKTPLLIFVGFLLGGGMAWAQTEAAEVWLQRAEAAAAAGRSQEAVGYFQQAAEAAPEQESLRFRLAAAEAQARRWTEAERGFRALAQSANAEMARLAEASMEALSVERQRREAYAKAEVELQRREAAFRRAEAALQAKQRAVDQAQRLREADLQARQEIFDAFEAKDPERALALLKTYERRAPVPTELRWAQIFTLLEADDPEQAAAVLQALPEAERNSIRGWLVRGRLARAQGRPAEAWADFREAELLALDEISHEGQVDGARRTELQALAREAREEIRLLPPAADADRWAWGELQLDALYQTRFSDAIFYGQLRQGTFIPGARWIQPYVQLDFTLDTKSGMSDGQPEVFANNLAGGHLGLRIQPWIEQDIFFYALIGPQKDLLGTTRYEGAWFLDWRVGARGYQGWGPGLNFLHDEVVWKNSEDKKLSWEWHPRAAWFVEAGADAAYYSLYLNFIAYGQLREGLRVGEMGGWLGWDIYALQNGSADSLGLYYNNLVEFGLGTRFILRLSRQSSLVARLEGLGGAYAGRDEENSRGTLPATYTDLRASLSLWSVW